MARKKKHPEHENLERWLVSYADFITLLFATFTALYALSQSDIQEEREYFSQAVRQGFQQTSIMHGINSILQGQSPPSENPDPISPEQGAGQGLLQYESMTYQPGEIRAVREAVERLQADLEEVNREIARMNAERGRGSSQTAGSHAPNLGDAEDVPLYGVEVAIQERGLKVSFDSRVLFEPGTATLRRDSLKFIDTVVSRLKGFHKTHMIHIEGHTDDLPIATAVYPSNWELSGARSSSIVRHLIRKHEFSPNSLVVVGYGASQPIATNRTPAGRAKNRRVDIIIHSRKVGELINPSRQAAGEEKLIRAEERGADGELLQIQEEEGGGPGAGDHQGKRRHGENYHARQHPAKAGFLPDDGSL